MYVNQAAINHYGYSNLEFLNMTLLDLLPPLNVPKVLAYVQAQNRQLNQTYTGEFKTYKKSGELIDVQTFSTPLIISNQKTTLVIVLDVTEKNLYEQKITKAIIQAQENERYEIGAELHENVCQILFAGHMSLKMLKDSLQVKDLVWYNQSIEYMQAAIQEIRGLTHRLAPVFYEDSTLEESIIGLIANLNIENQFDFTLLLDEAFKNFPCKQEFQLTLYRILQEQFRNIIKHAQATTIKVNGNITDDVLIMSITDNGTGFDIKKVKSGIGLANMRRRIEVFMGKFILVSSLGNGCTVSLIVPLEYIYKID
jgi:PAS domain S-box-containing protein